MIRSISTCCRSRKRGQARSGSGQAGAAGGADAAGPGAAVHSPDARRRGRQSYAGGAAARDQPSLPAVQAEGVPAGRARAVRAVQPGAGKPAPVRSLRPMRQSSSGWHCCSSLAPAGARCRLRPRRPAPQAPGQGLHHRTRGYPRDPGLGQQGPESGRLRPAGRPHVPSPGRGDRGGGQDGPAAPGSPDQRLREDGEGCGGHGHREGDPQPAGLTSSAGSASPA